MDNTVQDCKAYIDPLLHQNRNQGDKEESSCASDSGNKIQMDSYYTEFEHQQKNYRGSKLV